MKRTKGITLITLIITIIVLLIIVGVTIGVLSTENGILNKAENAIEENNKQTATEKINLKITKAQIESYSKTQQMPNLQFLADSLCEDGEIQYVELTTQKIASIEKANLKSIMVGEAKSIFTKLKEYPYEFEIDEKLRLASINGIKVGTSEDITKEEIEAIKLEIQSLKDSNQQLKESNQELKDKVEKIEQPIGAVISYMGNNAPNGYLKCDGSIYNIADYSKLAEQIKNEFGRFNYYGGNGATTFAVPDLRGEFLRGTGTNTRENQGGGANVGQHQDATAIPNFRFNVSGLLGFNDNKEGWVSSNPDSVSYPTVLGIYLGNSKAMTEKSASNFTTRPTNTSVLYCIKF